MGQCALIRLACRRISRIFRGVGTNNEPAGGSAAVKRPFSEKVGSKLHKERTLLTRHRKVGSGHQHKCTRTVPSFRFRIQKPPVR
jgi:hypothetical protein